jgi:hypothetical protein
VHTWVSTQVRTREETKEQKFTPGGKFYTMAQSLLVDSGLRLLITLQPREKLDLENRISVTLNDSC